MEARDRGLPAYAETCPQYLFLSRGRSARQARRRVRRAPSTCARRRCGPKHHHEHLWRGLRNYDLQVVVDRSLPVLHEGAEGARPRTTSRRSRTACRASRRACTCCGRACAQGKISMNRFVEITSTAPAKIFGLYPQEGHDRGRRRRRRRRVGSEKRYELLGTRHAAHARRLLAVRGHDGHRRADARALARRADRRERQVGRQEEAGPRPVRAPRDVRSMTKDIRTDAAWLDAHWMPFTGNRQFKAHPRMIVARRGRVLHRRRRQEDLRRPLGPVVLRPRPRPPRDRRGGRRSQVATLDYAPAFQFGHPHVVRAREQDQGAHAGRASTTCSSRGSGSEAADTSLKMARAYWRAKGQGTQDAPDRPREGLSRRQLRRHLGRRHRRQPQDVRPGASRPITCRTRSSRSRQDHAFTRGMPKTRRRARRRAARPDRAARRVEHRRGDRRAVRRLGRRRHPAGRLPAAPARDLHREQHPADLRRGDHRLRPRGRVHRRRGVRRHARHPELREAGHQRRAAARRASSRRRRSTTRSWPRAAPSTCSSSRTATRTRRIRSRARPASPRSTCSSRSTRSSASRELAPYFENAVHALKGAKHVTDIRNFGLAAGLTIEAAPGRAGEAAVRGRDEVPRRRASTSATAATRSSSRRRSSPRRPRSIAWSRCSPTR